MEASQAKGLGANLMNNFRPSKHCISARNKARQELLRLRPTMPCRKPGVWTLYAVIRDRTCSTAF